MWVPLEVDYEIEQPKAETPKQTSRRGASG